MTHSGFLGISCCNSAKVLAIIIELLLCIRPQNAIKVIKCFPSTVTGCCVACSWSSLWVKNDPFRRSSVKLRFSRDSITTNLHELTKNMQNYRKIPTFQLSSIWYIEKNIQKRRYDTIPKKIGIAEISRKFRYIDPSLPCTSVTLDISGYCIQGISTAEYWAILYNYIYRRIAHNCRRCRDKDCQMRAPYHHALRNLQ